MCRSLAVLLFTFGLFGLIDGITTSGNPNDSKYIVTTQDYPFFVSIGGRGNCAGTIISKRHVATAAHCMCNDNGGKASLSSMNTILSDNSEVTPVQSYENQDCMFSCSDDGPNKCDVLVLEYDQDIAADGVPVPIYTWDDEVGKTLTILGFGITGDAGSGSCTGEDGKFRRANNVVTQASDFGNNRGGVLGYRMDQNGLALEGMAQDGDSGGPALIELNGQMYLAGANSGTMEDNPCDYGSIDEYCRLSTHSTFLCQYAVQPSGNHSSGCPAPGASPSPGSPSPGSSGNSTNTTAAPKATSSKTTLQQGFLAFPLFIGVAAFLF